jgi:DMSO/TMAO reductase YedYZ molybdopterin-dependent catalytic subunit
MISLDELQLAARNHGMPLEALRHEITPVGLHYLLTHYDIPLVDAGAWRLTVDGLVDRPLELTLDDLRARETVTMPVTMECAGNGRTQVEPHVVSQPWITEAIGTMEWTGVPVTALLAEAGATGGEVVFTGLDRGVEGGVVQDYARSLSRADCDGALLAYGCNGEPLPPQHGFPLRLIVPGWYGMTSVKWLSRITAVGEEFGGYQMATSYRFRSDPDEVGEAVTRIRPRSLMIPPGIPEFLSRSRVLDAGTHEVRGRAWSGLGAIERVEFSDDDGGTWVDTRLDAPHRDSTAWRGWSIEWGASPGARVLCCRATDYTGATQPLEPGWNVGGYANNAVQRVPIFVR